MNEMAKVIVMGVGGVGSRTVSKMNDEQIEGMVVLKALGESAEKLETVMQDAAMMYESGCKSLLNGRRYNFTGHVETLERRIMMFLNDEKEMLKCLTLKRWKKRKELCTNVCGEVRNLIFR